MKILIIGSGGREHAIAWALKRSPQVEKLYTAPGNAGTAGMTQNVPIGLDDHQALLNFAQQNGIDLTVVGPEVPLAAGIVDRFQAAGLRIFGPTQAAAQIEASKSFAKDFMQANGIPTAAYGAYRDYKAAQNAVDEMDRPLVIKADGLAAGKGVFVCETRAEAHAALQEISASPDLKAAAETIVIEERLTGREVSLLAFTDGKTIVPMPPARDHKRIFDGDEGPNTGGMGAFTPLPDLTADDINFMIERVLKPTIAGMAGCGSPFVGILYAGLMMTPDGPKVLEFNCRFGDPETQALLPLLESHLAEILWACTEGRLHEVDVRWKSGACATVVVASPGYPGAYPKGLPISGLESAAKQEDVIVFHAGTAERDGQIVTAGGRVLAVSGIGADMDSALARAYAGIDQIHFEGMHYRRDIGRTGQ